MTITIHSRDEAKQWIGEPSRGKTTFAYSQDFNVESDATSLTLTAHYAEMIGSGARGGTMKDIVRDVTLQLSARDLKRILKAALGSNLLEASFSIPKREPAKAIRKQQRK